MSSPLRVAAIGITPPVFKASGGISAGVQLTRHVAKLCDARFVMMSTEDSEAVEDGLTVIRRKPGNILQPLSGIVPNTAVVAMWRPNLREWLARERPSIVHFHNPHPPGALAQAVRDCRALGIPYVISTHGFVEFNDYAKATGASPLMKPVYRRLIWQPVAEVARNAARVLMLSPEEEPILRAMGVDPARLDVVTNGVDRYFLETALEMAQLTARFNLPADRARIFFVGNHTPNKGIDVLLRAMPLMKEKAVIVIGGAIRSQAEHQALLDGTGVAKGDPRVLFTDFISKDELRALYQAADVFAFPSYADTLPLVILEAMASRLPVVSTRIGGIPYEVTPQTGALVDSGDAVALARELDALCADPARRVQLGEAGRERAIALFDWAKSAEKTVGIYRAILGGHG
ncbi:MAG TPA: glycosyltransferase family 4 protein [Rhizomicrobium sp.]|jgi:glycosyltransferase involved in cell wall biosynthesis|nr:glycosyltransferase family 4 protein [Rhizomicrobium sp.]